MEAFNYRMLTLARESRGLTQKELSEITNIPQSSISRIENGTLGLDADILSKLSFHLNYPESFFFQNFSVIPSNLHYRKKASVSVKTINKAEAVMNIFRANIQTLLKSVDIPNLTFPEYSKISNHSPQEFAQYLRDFWRVEKGPVQNLTKLLEDRGILIIQTDLFSDKIDGRSVMTDSGQFIIFINNDLAGDRQRFTLAHELGHIMLHINSPNVFDVDIEAEANAFASEFLMPSSEILQQLSGRVDLQRLADLKRYWKVSMQAILYWATKLNAITGNQSKYLWSQFSSMGIRKKEPIEIPAEKATLIFEVIGAYLNDLNYSKHELGSLLNLKIEEFEERYFPKRIGLRLVKS